MNYFRYRKVSEEMYRSYRLPGFLKAVLPVSREARILDIGCGLGQLMCALREAGYGNSVGIDISPAAVEACLSRGLRVELIEDLESFVSGSGEKYEFIIMSHILEHLPKEKVITVLQTVRERLLSMKGSLFLSVPNAQSNTGCYWAYEDFTHNMMFTAGSLHFCLLSAGFKSIAILDPHGLSGCPFCLRFFRQFLLKAYDLNYLFWNLVTSSSFHRPSPRVYSFELKMLAGNGQEGEL